MGEADEEISYLALQEGTPVRSVSGTTFGTVEHVLQVPDLDLFDGVVVHAHHRLRFVDRDRISRITRAAVLTDLTDAETTELPVPEGPPVEHVDAFEDVGPTLTARLGRMFRRSPWIGER